MSKVRIIQLLCPERHCVVGTAYESEDGEIIPAIAQYLQETFSAMVSAGALNPWCGICQSRNLHQEDQPTKWVTMAEAKPHLEESERQQAASREFLKASKG